MSFMRYKETKDGLKLDRKKVVIDCSNDEILTEQSHAREVNINQIIKRHGIDLIAKTNAVLKPTFRFDDVSGNDFTEAMNILTNAQKTFGSLPSEIRKEFDNSPAQFLDFVQNPDNQDKMIEMGLAQRIPEEQPINVNVVNQTPTESETPPS
jgi:phage internal scaffolding protein